MQRGPAQKHAAAHNSAPYQRTSRSRPSTLQHTSSREQCTATPANPGYGPPPRPPPHPRERGGWKPCRRCNTPHAPIPFSNQGAHPRWANRLSLAKALPRSRCTTWTTYELPSTTDR